MEIKIFECTDIIESIYKGVAEKPSKKQLNCHMLTMVVRTVNRDENVPSLIATLRMEVVLASAKQEIQKNKMVS